VDLAARLGGGRDGIQRGRLQVRVVVFSKNEGGHVVFFPVIWMSA
jgi:hypothetical protein